MGRMVEKRKRWWICIGALAVAVEVASGLVPAKATMAPPHGVPFLRVDLTQDKNDFAAIAGWAARYGHKINLRGDIAKRVGLSRGNEVTFIGVSYENNSGLNIFLGVLPGRPDIIMARSDQNFTIYWFVRDGVITSTIYSDEKGIKEIVPVDYYEDAYRKLLAIWLVKEKSCAADSTTCPSP